MKAILVRALGLAGVLATAGLMTGALAQGGGGGGGRRGGYPYRTGQELYEHICQGCHMPDAKGAVGAAAYPALAGDRKLQSPVYPAVVVLRGQKAMPSFADLDDEQVAAVVNYVRSHFGNAFAGEITAAQVTPLRPRAPAQEAGRPG